MNLEKVGKFIAELRKEKNMTQEQLGSALMVDRRTISKWENGKIAPDISLLEKISTTFEISINELLHGERNEKKTDDTAESIKFYTKIYKNKLIKIFSGIIFVLIVSFIIFNSTRDYYEYNATNLITDTKDYELVGIAIYNRQKAMIYISDVAFNDEIFVGTDREVRLVSLKATLYQNDKFLISKEYDITPENGKKDIVLSEALEDVDFYYDVNEDMTDKLKDLYIVLDYTDTKNMDHKQTVHVLPFD